MSIRSSEDKKSRRYCLWRKLKDSENFRYAQADKKDSPIALSFIIKKYSNSENNLNTNRALLLSDSVISTRKAIEASSTYNNWKPTNAVDGLIRTNDPDVCLCCAATQPETNPWLKLDLGDTFFITLIQLYGRTDSTPTGRKFFIYIYSKLTFVSRKLSAIDE